MVHAEDIIHSSVIKKKNSLLISACPIMANVFAANDAWTKEKM